MRLILPQSAARTPDADHLPADFVILDYGQPPAGEGETGRVGAELGSIGRPLSELPPGVREAVTGLPSVFTVSGAHRS